MELNARTVKKKSTRPVSRYRLAARRADPKLRWRTNRREEEILDFLLLFDEKRVWRWACKMYGKTFMSWVRQNWVLLIAEDGENLRKRQTPIAFIYGDRRSPGELPCAYCSR